MSSCNLATKQLVSLTLKCGGQVDGIAKLRELPLVETKRVGDELFPDALLDHPKPRALLLLPHPYGFVLSL